MSCVGVPATDVAAIVSRCPPFDMTMAESSGDQSGDASATDVPVTCTGPDDPSAATTYTSAATDVSILVKAIFVPSLDHVVSNSCVPAPKDVIFVVTSATESQT